MTIDTTEVRVTSATGASKGVKDARFDLVPSRPLRSVAEMLAVTGGYEKDTPESAVLNDIVAALVAFQTGDTAANALPDVAYGALWLISDSRPAVEPNGSPARYDLIPTQGLRTLAEHYGKGAKKYPRVGRVDNWRMGYSYSSSVAALWRHLNAHMNGEYIDEELNSPHLVAVAWHAFTLMEFAATPGFENMFDDRQDTAINPPNATADDVMDLIRTQLAAVAEYEAQLEATRA